MCTKIYLSHCISPGNLLFHHVPFHRGLVTDCNVEPVTYISPSSFPYAFVILAVHFISYQNGHAVLSLCKSLSITYMKLIKFEFLWIINPLKPELNPICYLLALLGAHHFLHVNRIRVKLLTFRLLMS